MTHSELVKRAAQWLRRRGCHAVFTELSTADEVPDAIGWLHGTYSLLVECKVSKSDFYADQQKPFRKHPHKGMGYRRFYMVPKGLLTVDDVKGLGSLLGEPESGWGLLEVSGNRVVMTKKSQAFLDRNLGSEMRVLVSALRRIQLRIDRPLDQAIKWGTQNDQLPLLEAPPSPELMYL